jgi:hypothetical protein
MIAIILQKAQPGSTEAAKASIAFKRNYNTRCRKDRAGATRAAA